MATGSYSGRVPAIGVSVYTADGEELGRVKEVQGTCFKVDAPMRPDYWLASDAIGSGSDSDVRLMIRKDELDEAKIDAGGDHTGYHAHPLN